MYVGCRKKGQRFDPEWFAEKVEWMTYGEFGDRLKAFGLCSRQQLARSLPFSVHYTRWVRVLLTALHVSGRGRMRAGAGLKELGMVSQPDNVSKFEEVAAPCYALSVLLRKRALWLCRLPLVHERTSSLREPRQEAQGKERVTRNGDERMESGAWRLAHVAAASSSSHVHLRRPRWFCMRQSACG